MITVIPDRHAMRADPEVRACFAPAPDSSTFPDVQLHI
jgi:hypothetical protein